jgi:hypothetical protein
MILNALNRMAIAFVFLLVIFLVIPTLPAAAQSDPAELAKAVVEIENLDAMRSGLAGSLEGIDSEPTMQTMKEVCKPVGMQAKQLSKENGWQVKQIAKKYRNPDHAPDNLHAQIALSQFAQQPELKGMWERETIAGQEGTRYYRRIDVEASCLACHGAKSDRPGFVKANYPQDLAYDFKVGDLRGMYAVFIPDLKAALATPATSVTTEPSATPEPSTPAAESAMPTNPQDSATTAPPVTPETSEISEPSAIPETVATPEVSANSETSEPQQFARQHRRQQMRQKMHQQMGQKMQQRGQHQQMQQRQCDRPGCMDSPDFI